MPRGFVVAGVWEEKANELCVENSPDALLIITVKNIGIAWSD